MNVTHNETSPVKPFVSEQSWPKFVVKLKELPNKVKQFKAGCISNRLKFWKKLTSDQTILNSTQGCKIEFDYVIKQNMVPQEYRFNRHKSNNIDSAIRKMLKKGIINKLSQVPKGAYFSNIFTRDKKMELS